MSYFKLSAIVYFYIGSGILLNESLRLIDKGDLPTFSIFFLLSLFSLLMGSFYMNHYLKDLIKEETEE